MNQTTKNLTMTALIAAVICVLGPLSIPIGPVPISLGVLGIFLGVYILGPKYGTAACLIYLLLGLVGLPVFTGFTGGVGKLFGPTGGYLIGYIPMALIAGWFIDRFYDKVIIQAVGMIIGLIILYALGTAWLAFQASMTFKAALAAGVLPFIPFDIGKMIVSIILGRAVRNALVGAGIMSRHAAA